MSKKDKKKKDIDYSKRKKGQSKREYLAEKSGGKLNYKTGEISIPKKVSKPVSRPQLSPQEKQQADDFIHKNYGIKDDGSYQVGGQTFQTKQPLQLGRSGFVDRTNPVSVMAENATKKYNLSEPERIQADEFLEKLKRGDYQNEISTNVNKNQEELKYQAQNPVQDVNRLFNREQNPRLGELTPTQAPSFMSRLRAGLQQAKDQPLETAKKLRQKANDFITGQSDETRLQDKQNDIEFDQAVKDYEAGNIDAKEFKRKTFELIRPKREREIKAIVAFMGGSPQGLMKAVAKSTEKNFIRSAMRGQVADDVLEKLLPDLVNAKSAKEVEGIIKGAKSVAPVEVPKLTQEFPKDTLIQEARKYKSAEDFIKSQGKDTPIDIAKNKAQLTAEIEKAKQGYGQMGAKLTKKQAQAQIDASTSYLKVYDRYEQEANKLTDIWNKSQPLQEGVIQNKGGEPIQQSLRKQPLAQSGSEGQALVPPKVSDNVAGERFDMNRFSSKDINNKQRQSSAELIKSQGDKIADDEIRVFREQNLLEPETIDEIILRKRGVITDKEAVERAKRFKITLDDVINTPAGTVPNKEKLTAIGQIVQEQREVNQQLRRILEGKGAPSTPAERKLLESASPKYANLSEPELLNRALEQSTLKLKKAEISLMAAKSEAGRSLQGAKQLVEAVDGRMRIVYGKIKNKTPLEQQSIIDQLAREPIDDPKNFIKLLDNLNDADIFDKFAEASVAAKLWNPTTHIVNFGSNTVRQIADTVITDITNPSLAKADAQGVVSGLRVGIKNFVRAMTDEGYAAELSKYIETGGKTNAIGGTLGKIIRTPFRALGAADEIFKGIAHQRSLYRQASRLAKGDKAKMKELLEKPTFAMIDEANNQAIRMTFQEEMGAITSKLNELRNPAKYTGKVGKGSAVVARAFLPFLKTPTNLIKQSLDFSPLGFLKNKNAIVEGLKAGGIKAEQSKRLIGEAIVGTGIMAYTIGEVSEGKITGAAPKDKKEQDLFYKEGKLPYSIKVGDEWYQYKRVEPFSTVLGAVADFYNLKNEDDLSAGTIINKITQQLSDKTYLQGIEDITNLFSGEEWEQKSAFNNMILGSTIPSIVGHTARSTDKTIRGTDSFLDRLKSQIPGLSKDLPAQHDFFGEEKKRQTPWSFLNPLQSTTESNDPLIKEMRRMQDAGYGIVPPKSDEGETIKEKEEFRKIFGQETKSAYQKIIESPFYKSLNDAEKQKLLDGARSDARELTKEKLFGESNLPKNTFEDDLKYIDLRDKLKSGKVSEFYDAIDGMTKEEQDKYGAVKGVYPEFKGISPYTKYDDPVKQKGENTRTFKERLNSADPKEALRFLKKLDAKEQKRILDLLDNKGNEEVFKKYNSIINTSFDPKDAYKSNFSDDTAYASQAIFETPFGKKLRDELEKKREKELDEALDESGTNDAMLNSIYERNSRGEISDDEMNKLIKEISKKKGSKLMNYLRKWESKTI